MLRFYGVFFFFFLLLLTRTRPDDAPRHKKIKKRDGIPERLAIIRAQRFRTDARVNTFCKLIFRTNSLCSSGRFSYFEIIPCYPPDSVSFWFDNNIRTIQHRAFRNCFPVRIASPQLLCSGITEIWILCPFNITSRYSPDDYLRLSFVFYL